MRVVRDEGVNLVSYHVGSVAWFVSIKASGSLDIGRYEGDELRLVGTQSIPLAELDRGTLQKEIEEALARQISASLDASTLDDDHEGTKK